MSVIYYSYYKFYSSVMKDDEPHLLTILALSASLGFVADFLIKLILMLNFCKIHNALGSLIIIVFIAIINYFFFYTSGRAVRIVSECPMFFGSRPFSILVALLFFSSTLSFVFWGLPVIEGIFESCDGISYFTTSPSL